MCGFTIRQTASVDALRLSFSHSNSLKCCVWLQWICTKCPNQQFDQWQQYHLCHAGVCEVLSHCSVTLAPASEILLGIVLALAADEWPQVAEPCRAFLGRGWAGSADAGRPSQRHLLAGLISKLVLGLADAAKGNQDALILHARRLSTALQVPTASLTGPSPLLAEDLSTDRLSPLFGHPAPHGASISHLEFDQLLQLFCWDAQSVYLDSDMKEWVTTKLSQT